MTWEPLDLVSDPSWLTNLAKEYGFRPPRLDEDLVVYERALLRHVDETNATLSH